MIANEKRGETIISINGRPYILCLTLGGLAKIETAFGISGLEKLDAKFQSLSANDVILLLAILLEGGANPLSLDEIKSAKIDTKSVVAAILKCFALNIGGA